MDIEQKAQELGWVPQDQYKGDPERFIGAEEFVERGQHIMPILRKNNEKLLTEVEKLKYTVEEQKRLSAESAEALEAFKRYHAEDSKRQYERAKQELKAMKKEALADQDYDKLVEIDESMVRLEREREKEVAPQPKKQDPSGWTPPKVNEEHPDFKEWREKAAPWYGHDKERTDYTNAIASYIRMQHPAVVGKEFLALVQGEIDKRFGSDVQQRRQALDRVESGTGTTSSSRSSGSKGFHSLPKEAQEACMSFAPQLVGKGKAYKDLAEWQSAYTKDYLGEA